MLYSFFHWMFIWQIWICAFQLPVIVFFSQIFRFACLCYWPYYHQKIAILCSTFSDPCSFCQTCNFCAISHAYAFIPSVLWRCWLGGRKGIRPVKNEWWGAGMVICLERCADLPMAHLMPLPLTVSCFSKSRLVLLFWYRLTWVIPDKGPLNVCVCVCSQLNSLNRELRTQVGAKFAFAGICTLKRVLSL